MGRKAAAIAALMGFAVLSASAQSRVPVTGHSVASRSSGSSHSVRGMGVMVRSGPFTARTPGSVVNSALTNSYLSGSTLQDLLGYPVPGLGFDYAQLAAVNGNLGVRALIDPVTQQELALALRLRGTGFGAYPYFFSPFAGAPIVLETPTSAAQPDPPPQAPIIVVSPPVAQAPPPAEPVADDQPLPDPGEFVLVQRDGRLLFAVAFTSDPGRVVYITKEGLRRSIALDQLDVDATVRMNEERGTSIQLPKA